ncbi:uncharacterized protein LOC144643701 [Oculina patagonica]
MQALPYLQLRESERPATTEKKSYRLSLHETSPKTVQHSDGQSRSGNNVNRTEYSRDSNALFEGTSSIYFGDIAPFRTPVPSPSPSRILKRPPRTQNHSSLPTWVEPLGVWLTNKQKCNNYETFTRNVELLRRTSDMFMDPCPHVPRCSHERTLSALRRQRHKFKTEGEWKKQERHMRIIERVQQIRDIWEQWTNKTSPAGAEHENRLNNFRKSRDGYADPEDVIRKKREERMEREKMIRLEQETKRQELLEKKRFRLPKIIVTQYFDAFDESRAQSAKRETPSVLPNLVNIPCGSDSDRGREDSDAESQGSKGDRLELPELVRNIPEDYFEDIEQADEQQNESLLPENGDQVEAGTDVNDSNSHEIDLGVNSENVVLESEKVSGGDISQSEVAIEPESVPVSEEVNMKIDDQNIQQIEQKTSENSSDEQCNAAGENGEGELEEKKSERRTEEKESERKVEKKESELKVEDKESNTRVEENETNGKVEEKNSENEEEKNEIQMSFLAPPSVPVMAGENGSDHGSIGDADETASLMAAFIPVALGVGNGVIPNDAMRASSVLDRYHVPSLARLNNTKQGKIGGAWKPKVNDKKQYLEVDLGAITKISQVATQGYPTASGVKVHKKDKCWVESYTLSFSTDGSQWQQYTENGVVKVFKGNRDNNSIVINSISNPTEARFVRFIPQSWKNSIAMRVEVYGEVTDLELDMTSNSPPPPSTVEQEQEEKEHFHEVILEDEEEPEVEVCGADNKEVIVEQDAWEEETVCSVVETASQIQSRVAVVSRSSQSMTDLAVQGEKTPKTKRKSKKPKQDKQEDTEEKKKKKKKTKKIKQKKVKDPIETSLIRLDEVEEEEGASSPEEQEGEEEEEEETERKTPSLPEIPKRPESVKRIPPAPKRTFSMFPVKKEEPSRPVRRRAQTDDSIRNELMRQQLAEDRRKKLEAAMGKPKREIQTQSPVYDNYGDSSGLDDFLSKYCIISEGQANYYRRIFKSFDEDKDGMLFPEDVLEALESVNSNLLSDSHITYIYRVLELCDCSLDSGVDMKLFSVIAAFSQRVAVLDEFAKILISKLDFRELDFKLQRAKRLFLCYVDEAKKTISLEELMLGLTAGGLTAEQKEQTLKILGRTASLDFLDFLTYIPLFIHIHDHILQDPLGTVVYKDILAV